VKLLLPTAVTIVYGGALVHGTWKAGTIRASDGALLRANVERKLEGVVWCRGHVTERDEAGKALLATAAMDDGGQRVEQLVKKFWKMYPDQEFARAAQRRR